MSDQEQFVQSIVKSSLDNLSQTDKERLSKVLFPETDTKSVSFCGATRELHPLPLKTSKNVFKAMQPFAELANKANAMEESVLVGDEELASSLQKVANILCDFYQWGDEVKRKITEEDVSLEELQALATVQQQVQGSNDFLLASLRLAVAIMRVRALMDVQVQSMDQSMIAESQQSTSTTQPSSESGTAPSTT